MAKTAATPEEIEAARALVAKADADAAAENRKQRLAAFAPLAEGGWGSSDSESPLQIAIRAARDNAQLMAQYDPNFPSTLYTLAMLMATVDDKVRSEIALNQEPSATPA